MFVRTKALGIMATLSLSFGLAAFAFVPPSADSGFCGTTGNHTCSCGIKPGTCLVVDDAVYCQIGCSYYWIWYV